MTETLNKIVDKEIAFETEDTLVYIVNTFEACKELNMCTNQYTENKETFDKNYDEENLTFYVVKGKSDQIIEKLRIEFPDGGTEDKLWTFFIQFMVIVFPNKENATDYILKGFSSNGKELSEETLKKLREIFAIPS